MVILFCICVGDYQFTYYQLYMYISFNIIRVMKLNGYLVVKSERSRSLSQVLLGVDDVFVAHTLVPCAPFTKRRASVGALITSWVRITGSLRYWRIIRCYTNL